MERLEFFEKISDFSNIISTVENLKLLEIKSVSLLQEPFGSSLNPKMIFKKNNGEEYSIKGEEKIIEHTNELKEKILNIKNKK